MATRQQRTMIRWGLGVIAVLTAIALVTSLSPWPTAMLIRAVFERGGAATVQEMLPHVPDTPLAEDTDLRYRAEDPDATLSVFRPAGAAEPRATVVWVHGGAWISGSQADVAPYLRMIAGHGYTTVALDYSLAPERSYPTAVEQLNDALAYLEANAAELGIDPDRIVLAGDSAGAQLASQLAALTTNPEYAALLGIEPALDAEQVVGTVLNCGVYDLRSMAELRGITHWGFKIALWAYTGTKNWSQTYAGATMSTVNFVTEDFPETFISGGNGDSLTWIQSIPMSQRLQDRGVPVDALFFAQDHEPQLPHEYQFHLDLPDAQLAFDRTLAFLDRVTAAEPGSADDQEAPLG